jgi:hypothetical protein
MLQKRRAGREIEAEAITVVWTADEERLPDAWEPGPGEGVALDTYEIEEPAEGEPVKVRTVERVTTVPGDRGNYFDAAGRRIGRVLEITRAGLVRIGFEGAAASRGRG